MNRGNNVNHNGTTDGGTIQLQNKYLKDLEFDYLYHLNLSTDDNLEEKFGDVKFVCMGGTPHRMRAFAEYMQKELNINEELVDLTGSGNRFSLYKVGPLISVSHGMGMPSLSILLHELIKLLAYAKCKDPVLIRIGTSGGVGVTPGTLIVTKEAVNGFLRSEQEFVNLGKLIKRPAIFDPILSRELVDCSLKEDNFTIEFGNTIGTDDFFEGQGRLDGAICEHTNEEKMKFLRRAYDSGVRNIEMECTILAAITHKLKIRAADICVTYLDRLNGDQVTGDKTGFEDRPQIIVGRYIKKKLGLN